MTDEAFQNRQRGKYQTALANLMPGTRDANLVTVTLYGRQAGMTSEELYDDIMANAPGPTRPNPVAVRRAIEHAARTVELGGRKNFGATTNAKTAAFDRIWTPKREPTAAERREAARKALPEATRGTVARLVAEDYLYSRIKEGLLSHSGKESVILKHRFLEYRGVGLESYVQTVPAV